ncbi:hypothetical protein J2Z50_003373 [Ensifer mexicanus]|nr:hypothetical protein [Sinorhizobium mexicanum]
MRILLPATASILGLSGGMSCETLGRQPVER